MLGGDRQAFRILVEREAPAVVAACAREEEIFAVLLSKMTRSEQWS